MATANNDTYAGALEVLLKQIASMKTLADADLPFVLQLETMVLQEIRSPEHQMAKAGLIPPAGQNPAGMGMPGGPGGGMGPGGPPMGGLGGLGGMASPPPSMQGAGVPGLVQSPAPANPDELRRILQA